MEITSKERHLLQKFQKQEITGSIAYRILAKRQKDPNNRDILNQIAVEEEKHYQTYRKYTGTDVAPSRMQLLLFRFTARMLGPTFAVKLMEKNEGDDQVLYDQLSHLPDIPKIIADEEKHEHRLIEMISEEKLKYMGSVVLGLNDALVELTGALAGLTLALRNPQLIALTGLVTGIAAAFSMAASEYLSTKSENTERHAVKASVYTGITYLGTVFVLILPFLLLHNPFLSLTLTLIAAVGIIAGFNYYYAIVRGEPFSRRFGEMIGLSLGVALLSFGVGLLLRQFFGIDI